MLGLTFYMMEVVNTVLENLNKDPVLVFGGNVQTPDRG